MDEMEQKANELMERLILEQPGKDWRVCCNCKSVVERSEMLYTKDCHGITMRLVCYPCYESVMSKGYDGVYYEEPEDEISVWFGSELN